MPDGSALIVIASASGGDPAFDEKPAQPAMVITKAAIAKHKIMKETSGLYASPIRLVAIVRVGQANNRIRRATIDPGAWFEPVPSIALP